ncbi:MAG: DUF4340 domain-containing protein, partial [Clostridia bacterium]|nr:DUF4340 domain-containing protein [Clostridia bacterium]
MLKKQTILIAVLCALFIGLIVAYFAVVKPIVEAEEPETETEAETYLPDEDVAMGIDKVLVYNYIESADIQSITVKNDYGKYRVYRDEDDIPQIEGFEGIAFHEESMSALMTSLGYASAMYRVENPNDLAEYGLAPYTTAEGKTKTPATFELVTKDGTRYNGVVGDKIVTGNGYYFLYEGRPDVVYVVDTAIADTVLSPVETLVAPMIVTPMTANDYFLVHDYMLMKGDEVIVHFDYIEEEDRANSEFVTKTYDMLYPRNLTPSAEAISEAMLGLYTTSENESLEVVHLGIDDEALAKYNLVENCYALYYTYSGIENFVLISPRNADGTFYAASSMFKQIVKANAEVFDFVTWDLFDWVESPFFQMKISFVTDITIESGDYSVTFDLKHIDAGVNSAGVDMGTDLEVTERGTDNKPDVTNFRQFYKTLLYASYEGECGLMESEIETYRGMGDSEAQLILTIHTESGRELRYRFFQYSERRSYVELNG